MSTPTQYSTPTLARHGPFNARTTFSDPLNARRRSFNLIPPPSPPAPPAALPTRPPYSPNHSSQIQLDDAAFNALLAQFALPSSGPTSEMNSSKLLVNKPDTWSGDGDNLSSFLVQVRLVFTRCPRSFNSDADKVEYACSFLRDEALQWAEPYLLLSSERRPLAFHSYPLFERELQERFGDLDRVEALANRLLLLEQTSSVADYSNDFLRLAYQLETLNWEPLTQIFLRGLNSELRLELAKTQLPSDLNELTRVARELDTRISTVQDRLRSPSPELDPDFEDSEF